MEYAFTAFKFLCFATGAVLLIASMLWTLGRSLVWLLEMLKVWHVLTLCVGVLRHGGEYRERIFWQAIQERASRSRFEANNIAKHAMDAAPTDGRNEL